MPSSKPIRRHLTGPGNSIPAAAGKLGIGEGTFRRAVDRGEVQVIEFGGLRRITDAEIERLRRLLGMQDGDASAYQNDDRQAKGAASDVADAAASDVADAHDGQTPRREPARIAERGKVRNKPRPGRPRKHQPLPKASQAVCE